jgi:hypothetical protein
VIYVIGAVAACLGIGIGIGIGYLLWRRPAHVSIEDRQQLQDRQLQLMRDLHANPDPQKAAELASVTRRLDAINRASDANWQRRNRAQRRGLRKRIERDLD